MTRRRSAWIALVAAVLLGAAYLIVKRRSSPVVAAPMVPPAPTPVAVDPVVVEAASVGEPVAAAEAVLEEAATAPLKVAKPEPRSWGSTRSVPARTPPIASPVPAEEQQSDVEEPLPTWVRVAIVAAALVAFFAVSLIATKQV